MLFHRESCKEATLVPKLELQANGDGGPSPWCLRASEVISRLAWNRGMESGRDRHERPPCVCFHWASGDSFPFAAADDSDCIESADPEVRPVLPPVLGGFSWLSEIWDGLDEGRPSLPSAGR